MSRQHENQGLQPFAPGNVAVSLLGYIHRHKLPKRWEPRQRGHTGIRNVLATDRRTAKRRHPSESRESFRLQIVAAAPPDVLDGRRLAQRHESLVARNGVLAAEEAEPGHAGNVRHGSVIRVDGKPAKVWQPDKRRQPRRRNMEFGSIEVESEEAGKILELRHAAVRKGAAKEKVIRTGVIAQQSHLGFAAMPALEDGNLAETSQTSVGHCVAASQPTKARLARKRSDCAVSGDCTLQVDADQTRAVG